MKTKDENSNYYSLDNILKRDCTYNIVFGERSNGKTYAVLKHGLENYLKGNGQLAIIRRWKEDIVGRRASDMFSALNANDEVRKLSGGKYEGITYWAGKYYLCVYDDNNKPIYNLETDCFAYVFALSDTEHNKSISYPKITTILFDEFITKHVYLVDEFVLFMNTLSTIIRNRTDVTIFMLGNTVNKYNPYFTEMGLKHASSMTQGSIDIYKYGDTKLKVAVEYCSSSTPTQKKNNYFFAFDNPKLEMITSGAWELDIYPHLPYKYTPKQVMLTYYIEFNTHLYQGNIIRDDSGDVFTYIHTKTTDISPKHADDVLYSLSHSYKMNHCRNIFKPLTQVQERILWFFKTDRVFYQNNSVGDAIKNYIRICRDMR